eukprot:13178446-Ditylum_brightwellii.AAC.1
MDEDKSYEKNQDVSTQDRTVGYNVQPPEEININDANQNDGEEDSMEKVSDLSLSKEPFEK